jgi:hypothetical protein
MVHPGITFGGFRTWIISPSTSGFSIPMLGMIGILSLARAMTPNCQPPSTRSPSAPHDLGVGALYKALITTLRPTLNDDSLRISRRSYGAVAFHSLLKVSAAALPEVSPILLLQVNEPVS